MRSLADRENERSRVVPFVVLPLGTLVLMLGGGGAMTEISIVESTGRYLMWRPKNTKKKKRLFKERKKYSKRTLARYSLGRLRRVCSTPFFL